MTFPDVEVEEEVEEEEGEWPEWLPPLGSPEEEGEELPTETGT